MRVKRHFAILSTFIKLPFVFKTFVYLFSFLSGRFTQVLLYVQKHPSNIHTDPFSSSRGTNFGMSHYLTVLSVCEQRSHWGICAGSPVYSILVNAISTKVSYSWSYDPVD